MTTVIPPLSHYLAEITDPRHAKGLRHPLVAILCLCCVALLSGAKTPQAIANWWKNRRDLGPFLERLGFTKPYGPSLATLYRVLSLIPCQVLEAQLCRWAEDILAKTPAAPGELEAMALDGKTLRGSRRQGAALSHLLSALSHRLGITLGQVAVVNKTSEITALPDLLTGLILEGRVVTMDALHTHRETAQTIVDGKGDYVMIVKGNQPTLRADIALLFSPPEGAAFIEDQASTTEKAHGRLETRTLQTSSALNDYVNWPGLQQVFRLDRKTVTLTTGEVRTETVYGLTSLSAERTEAVTLLKLVRSHWTIENRSHWVRDVTFGEDRSQVRQGSLPQAMAALRNCVISVMRLRSFRFIPDAFDFFAARPWEALAAIGC
jgi:predicted transposase YbfD/YdcC